MEKPADTTYPIEELLKRRWSPRAFADSAVEPKKRLGGRLPQPTNSPGTLSSRPRDI